MLFGIPAEVKSLFRPVLADASKPIRHAVAPMVLAFLLAPHYRRLKTISGMVLGHRVHVATISRRLNNKLWLTREWYVRLVDRVLVDLNHYECVHVKGKKRRFTIIIDGTQHASVGEKMESFTHRFNVDYIRQRLKSKRGQAELLRKLADAPCRVA